MMLPEMKFRGAGQENVCIAFLPVEEDHFSFLRARAFGLHVPPSTLLAQRNNLLLLILRLEEL